MKLAGQGDGVNSLLGRLRTGCGVAGATLLLLAAVAPTGAFGTFELPVRRVAESQPLAVLRDGVVWVDQGRVLYQAFAGGRITLGGIPASSTPVLAGSADAVVLMAARPGFATAFPPGRLASVEGIDQEVRHFAGAGCSSWSPALSSTFEGPSDFALAAGKVVDAGVCHATNGGFEEQELATAEPLFVHRLHGGGWWILRWLKGNKPPILATEGKLLAIGEPVSGATMRVTILDLDGRAPASRFAAPLGYLSFASSRRLVVSVPTSRERGVSFRPRRSADEKLIPRHYYGLHLYTVGGRPLAYLGTVEEPALVSHMHLLVTEEVEGHSVLAVRNILDGSRRRLIGFNAPARTLEAVAFRWPAVALLETTSVPLQQSEVTCEDREYHHPSPPLLRIFDLARSETYVPPPPSARLAPPRGPCPPRPLVNASG